MSKIDHEITDHSEAFKFIGEFIYLFSQIEFRLRRSFQPEARAAFSTPISDSTEEMLRKKCLNLDNFSLEHRSKIYHYFEPLIWTRNDVAHHIICINSDGGSEYNLCIQDLIPWRRKNPLNHYMAQIEKKTGTSPFYKVPVRDRPNMKFCGPYNIYPFHAKKLLRDANTLNKSIDINFSSIDLTTIDNMIKNADHLHHLNKRSLCILK